MIADTDLKSGRAPIDKLNCAFRLESRHCAMDILWHHISSVKQARRHVFAVTRIALYHLVVWLKARHGYLLDRVRLMRCFRSGHNWSVSNQREVNPRIRHEIGLKFIKIDVEGAIEPKRSRDRRDNFILISAKPLRLYLRISYLERSGGSSFHSWAARFLDFCGICHRWPRCRP